MIDAKSTILLPPLSFLKKAPFITMFSRIVENNILVTYPITVYTRKSTGKMMWLGFLYTFLFTGKDGKKVSFVSYPLCFDDNHKNDIYQRLLKEAEELATAFKASRIVYEGYQCITGDVIPPISTITFGNTVNPDFLTVAKENQFLPQEVNPCYEIDTFTATGDVTVYSISDFSKRRYNYLALCSVCDSFLQHIDVNTLTSHPPGVMDKVFFNKEWILFSQDQLQKGCMRWFPQSLFDKEKKGAKIVRTLFYNASPDFIHESVTGALKKISLSGITRVQINGAGIEDTLKDMGKKVYETVYMVKQL